MTAVPTENGSIVTSTEESMGVPATEGPSPQTNATKSENEELNPVSQGRRFPDSQTCADIANVVALQKPGLEFGKMKEAWVFKAPESLRQSR